ncbi:hypothetical protein [Methanolapillus ohkumae]
MNKSELEKESPFGPVQDLSVHEPGIIWTSGEKWTQEMTKENWQKIIGITIIINDEQLLKPYNLGFGANADGHIMIGTCIDCEITEKELDEVVRIVQEVGKRQGIENVPIVVYRTAPVTVELPPETPPDKSENETNESNNALPSFTLAMGLLAMIALIGIGYKNKQKK